MILKRCIKHQASCNFKEMSNSLFWNPSKNSMSKIKNVSIGPAYLTILGKKKHMNPSDLEFWKINFFSYFNQSYNCKIHEPLRFININSVLFWHAFPSGHIRYSSVVAQSNTLHPFRDYHLLFSCYTRYIATNTKN